MTLAETIMALRNMEGTADWPNRPIRCRFETSPEADIYLGEIECDDRGLILVLSKDEQ